MGKHSTGGDNAYSIRGIKTLLTKRVIKEFGYHYLYFEDIHSPRKMGTKWLVTEDALREYFKEIKELKKEDRISLHGITNNSKVTEKGIEGH